MEQMLNYVILLLQNCFFLFKKIIRFIDTALLTLLTLQTKLY